MNSDPSDSVVALKLIATTPPPPAQCGLPAMTHREGPKRVPGNLAEQLGAPAHSAPPGTDLCGRAFCSSCGGSRRSGEHSLQGRASKQVRSHRRGGPAPQMWFSSVLTPRRRLRRPSGLSSGSDPGLGASPEMPGSLAGSFWGWRWGGGRIKAPVPLPRTPPHPAPVPVPTSELRKDRKGISEFEGLVSVNRGHRSLGVASLAQPYTCS